MKKLILTLFVLLSLVLGSQAQTIHTIGEKFGGGIVFDITRHGKHGLIAETIDQSNDCKWKDIQSVIANHQNHSIEGKAFTDWRLPTKVELDKLCKQQDIVGGFAKAVYWGSSVSINGGACYEFFSDVKFNGNGIVAYHVRAIRDF